MSLLQCPSCQKPLSATQKVCPHCHCKISLWREVKNSIEQSPVRLVLLALCLVFLVGFGWYLRMNTGYKWPLYGILIAIAPLVPWILKRAYMFAGSDEQEQEHNAGSSAGHNSTNEKN